MIPFHLAMIAVLVILIGLIFHAVDLVRTQSSTIGLMTKRLNAMSKRLDAQSTQLQAQGATLDIHGSTTHKLLKLLEIAKIRRKTKTLPPESA